VNGEHVDTSRVLIRTVAAQLPGKSVSLSIRRQGRAMDISVTVAQRPPENHG
jgi:serine protease Do